MIFFFLFQGKAVTDNCKINYGGPTDRGEKTERQEADSDEEGERGVSGKHSNEKTSDFWASHCQPFQGLKTHTPAHTQWQVSACSTLYVLKSAQPNSTFQSLLSPFHHVSSSIELKMIERRVYVFVMPGFIPTNQATGGRFKTLLFLCFKRENKSPAT